MWISSHDFDGLSGVESLSTTLIVPRRAQRGMKFRNIPATSRREPPQQDSTGSTERRTATFEGTTFALGLPAPHSGVLPGVNGQLQARLGDFTAVANSSCLLDLQKPRAGVPDGKEQSGVHAEAGSTVMPRHQCSLL